MKGLKPNHILPEGLFEAWSNLYTKFVLAIDRCEKGETIALENHPMNLVGVPSITEPMPEGFGMYAR